MIEQAHWDGRSNRLFISLWLAVAVPGRGRSKSQSSSASHGKSPVNEVKRCRRRYLGSIPTVVWRQRQRKVIVVLVSSVPGDVPQRPVSRTVENGQVLEKP